MLKRSGVRKATGSYRTYSLPGKTAALVPEFTVEDLPSAELHPSFCACNEGKNTHDDDDDDDGDFIHSFVYRMIPSFIQSPIKWVPVRGLPGNKDKVEKLYLEEEFEVE